MPTSTASCGPAPPSRAGLSARCRNRHVADHLRRDIEHHAGWWGLVSEAPSGSRALRDRNSAVGERSLPGGSTVRTGAAGDRESAAAHWSCGTCAQVRLPLELLWGREADAAVVEVKRPVVELAVGSFLLRLCLGADATDRSRRP